MSDEKRNFNPDTGAYEGDVDLDAPTQPSMPVAPTFDKDTGLPLDTTGLDDPTLPPRDEDDISQQKTENMPAVQPDEEEGGYRRGDAGVWPAIDRNAPIPPEVLAEFPTQPPTDDKDKE